MQNSSFFNANFIIPCSPNVPSAFFCSFHARQLGLQLCWLGRPRTWALTLPDQGEAPHLHSDERSINRRHVYMCAERGLSIAGMYLHHIGVPQTHHWLSSCLIGAGLLLVNDGISSQSIMVFRTWLEHVYLLAACLRQSRHFHLRFTYKSRFFNRKSRFFTMRSRFFNMKRTSVVLRLSGGGGRGVPVGVVVGGVLTPPPLWSRASGSSWTRRISRSCMKFMIVDRKFIIFNATCMDVCMS